MEVTKDQLDVLQTILEHVPIRVFWKNQNLRYLGCNALFARDAGLSHPHELLGKSDFELSWRDQAELYRADDQVVMTSGLPKLGYEEPQATVEGSTIWLRTSKVPLRDADGNVIGVLGIYDDITVQKNAQEQLRLTQFATDRARDGVYWLDERARFCYVNESFCQTLGYTAQELRSLSIEDVAPVPTPEFYGLRWPDLEDRGSLAFETEHRHKDGRLIPVDVSANFARFGDHHYVIAFARNITARKAVEAQLRESEASFRTLFEQSPLATQIISPSGYTRCVNRAWEKLWGVPIEALSEYNVFNDHQLREKGLMPQIRQAFAGQSIAISATEYDKAATPDVPSSGGRLYVRSLLYPVIDERGEVREVVLLQEDLSERIRSEAALRDSEQRYRELFTQHEQAQCRAHLGHWRLDLSSRQLEWSDEVFRIFGIEKSNFDPSYQSFLNRVHPDDRQAVDAAFAESAKSRTSFDIEHRVLREDGSVRWVTESGQTVGGVEEGPPRSLGTVLDITERKQNEGKLKSSNDFLEKIIAHAAEGVSVCHATENFPYVAFSLWNDRMTELTGYNREEINRLGWYQSMYPDPDVQRRAVARMERMRDGHNLDAEEWEVTTKSGEQRILSISTSLLLLEEGKPEVVGLMHDITERRRAQKEQKRLQEQLSATQKMESVGRLAGGVAHDFNNMLSVILGRTRLAMEELEPDHPALEELSEVLDAAQRSAELTRQLLAFARRQTASPIEIDLNTKVSGMLKMLGRLMGEDIKIDWRPAIGLAHIKMDPSQIDQILANLCVNSRDAIRGVGNVRIQTGQVFLSEERCVGLLDAVPGDFVLLSFSDDGCGMEPEVLEHIFEPFFSTKGAARSTGLGLATVYGIVKQNGGHVEVTSKPGTGTCFKIYFPALKANASDVGEGPRSPLPKGGAETVLLVEDEPTVLRLTSRMLTKLGYRVLVATSPAEALEIAGAHQGRIDLLLTDVVMPEMSGWELSKELRTRYPHLRFLFMSGYTADVIAQNGVLDSDVPFIQKPYDIGALATKLREVLDP